MAVSSGRVTVNEKISIIISDDYDGCEAIIYNNSNSRSVFLGNAEVTSKTGLELPKGESIKIDLGPGEEIYGITNIGNIDISYLLTKNQ